MTARSQVAMIADPAALFNLVWFASTHRLGRGAWEVDMFEMVNEEKSEPKDRKLLLMKIGAVIVALSALGGVVYFMAFASAH